MVSKLSNRVEPGYVWYILLLVIVNPAQRAASIVDKVGKEALCDMKNFAPNYLEQEQDRVESWNKYFAKHGNAIKKTYKLRGLVRGGIPNHFRGTNKCCELHYTTL